MGIVSSLPAVTSALRSSKWNAFRPGSAAAGLEFASRQRLDLHIAGHQAAVVVDHVGPGVVIRDPRVTHPRRRRVCPKFEDRRQRFLERHGIEHLEAVVRNEARRVGAGIERLAAVGIGKQVGPAPGIIEIIFGAGAEDRRAAFRHRP